MSPIVEKERELSIYLEEWITARYTDWKDFYLITNEERRNGIYRLKSGTELMNLLNDIMGNIEDHLGFDEGTHIIPSRFSSIPQLLQFLENFNSHLKKAYPLIEQNLGGENPSRIAFDIYRICYDIDQMVTRCQYIYQADSDIPIPYQQAKSALRNNNIKLFVEMMGRRCQERLPSLRQRTKILIFLSWLARKTLFVWNAPRRFRSAAPPKMLRHSGWLFLLLHSRRVSISQYAQAMDVSSSNPRRTVTTLIAIPSAVWLLWESLRRTSNLIQRRLSVFVKRHWLLLIRRSSI